MRRLLLLVVCLTACRTGALDADVQRAALRYVFVTRETNARLVVWADGARRGPVLEALGEPLVAPPAAVLLTDSAVGVPVVPIRRIDLDTLFRAHPDGWDAFFRAYPRTNGVVEVATPRYAGDRQTATVVVGRACGEHCMQGWRVHVRRDARGGWSATGVDFLRVPGT
jgi:hypothetical protein